MVSTFHHYHHLISMATGLLKIYSLSTFFTNNEIDYPIGKNFCRYFFLGNSELITFCGALVFGWLILKQNADICFCEMH